MSTRFFVQTVVALAVLFFHPIVVSARAYSLTVAGERLEFVAQPERGYVVKVAESAGGIHVLAGISALDTEDATPVGGLDRRGVWVVENDGMAEQNEETIRSFRAGGRVIYAAPLFSSNGETVAIIPEIVLRMKSDVQMEEVQTLCEMAGCTIRKRMEFTTQEYLLEVLGPDAEAVFAALEQLGEAPEVEWACPNTAFRPELYGQPSSAVTAPQEQMQIASEAGDLDTESVFPNDEYFPMQWHLHNTGQSGGTPDADINAPEAWDISTGDPNVIIAIFDNGVDSNHPDLHANVVAGYDFYDDDDSPEPELDDWTNWHGTACAGLAAARGDNSIGVVGVAWNCKIMPIRRHRRSGEQGADGITIAEHATAFRWAAENGADILSNSWGRTYALPILHSAIVDITKPGGLGRNGRGCIVLACSHNESGSVRYPAVYSEVIAVGATDHNDLHSYYSNFGPELDVVAPSAPGCTFDDWAATGAKGWLWTTDISGTAGADAFNQSAGILDYVDAMSGTSGACPIAAGIAALILSVEPNLTGEEVRHFLTRSAKDLGDPGWDQYYGSGRVDARAALDMVLAKRADLNNDWRVGLEDLVILIESWESDDQAADIAPATRRDGFVDEQDLELLLQYWQVEIPEMDPEGN